MDRNNETIRLAKKAADAWRTTDTYHQAAQIIDMLISALEGDTTLTPPNEPLTWRNCERWSSQPPSGGIIFRVGYWYVEGQFWCLEASHIKWKTFLGTFTAARRREKRTHENMP